MQRTPTKVLIAADQKIAGNLEIQRRKEAFKELG